jgi:hypothetical protein
MYYAEPDANGNIVAFYSDEFAYPDGIPSTAIPITRDQWQDSVNNPGKYIVQNGQLVLAPGPSDDELLAQAKQAKIAEIESGFEQTIAAGFKSSATGTELIYGWQTEDQIHLQLIQSAIDKGIETFPIDYADINGNPVSIPDQATLTALATDADKFMWAQVKQKRNLVAQVNAATTLDAVNSITWTTADY